MSEVLPASPVLDSKQISPNQSMANLSTVGHGYEGSDANSPMMMLPILPIRPNPYLPDVRVRSPRPVLQGPSHFSEPTTKFAKQQKILAVFPLPDHWKAPHPSEPFGRVRRIIFNLLCLASFGHAGLDPIWAAICLEENGDESVWADGLRQTYERMSNMLVVAGLLLSTSAAFITTQPPKAGMVNYTLRGPYICILASFGLLIGGVIAGSASLLMVAKAQPYWSKEVSYANRFHVYCTLIVLSYPLFSIAIGTLLLAFGLLSAIWCAEDRAIQGACVIVLILPVSMAILFGISCATARARTQLGKSYHVLGF